MCKCTPGIRTPFCGKFGCQPPTQTLGLAMKAPVKTNWQPITDAPTTGKETWLGWESHRDEKGEITTGFAPRRGSWDIGTRLWIAQWEDRNMPIGDIPIPFDPQPDYFCEGFEPEPPTGKRSDLEIKIYSTTSCTFCKRAKEELGRLSISYHEVLLDSPERIAKFKDLGFTKVPQIYGKGEHIGGYMELLTWLDKNHAGTNAVP